MWCWILYDILSKVANIILKVYANIICKIFTEQCVVPFPRMNNSNQWVQLIIKSLKNYVYNLSGDVFPDTLKSDYEIDLGED